MSYPLYRVDFVQLDDGPTAIFYRSGPKQNSIQRLHKNPTSSSINRLTAYMRRLNMAGGADFDIWHDTPGWSTYLYKKID